MDAMNSRQLAEEIWKSIANALHDTEARDIEPEDKEGLLQELEGVLERHGKILPDQKLNEEREKNGEMT